PIIPAAHTPTPAQQSGIPTHGPRRTLAPAAPPERNPDAPDPVRSLAERTRAAIAARTGVNADRAAGDRAGEDSPQKPAAGATGATPQNPPSSQTGSSAPPSPERSPSASEPSSQTSTEKPSDQSSSTPEPESGTATPAEATTPRPPRYDVKSFRRWAEENPEEAAEI